MSLAIAKADLRQLTSRPRTSDWLMGHLLRVEAWLDARASRQGLYGMDDRALADIGLTRADLGRPDPAASWQSVVFPFFR